MSLLRNIGERVLVGFPFMPQTVISELHRLDARMLRGHHLSLLNRLLGAHTTGERLAKGIQHQSPEVGLGTLLHRLPQQRLKLGQRSLPASHRPFPS